MFTKKLLIAATAAVAVTNGIPIKGGCLVKSDLFGNTASSTGTAFDQSTQIATNLDTESGPTKARPCVTFEGQSLQLNSFDLTMNTPDTLNEFTMDNVGPSSEDGLVCIDASIAGAGTSPVSGALIWYNADIITEVSLSIGTETTRMGSKADTDTVQFVAFNNADMGSFIGFHGIINETHIEALGFITQKLAVDGVECSADPTVSGEVSDDRNDVITPGLPDPVIDPESGTVTPVRPVAEKDFVTEDDEDNDDTWYIVLIVCGGIILILAVVALVVCCCKKSSERTTSKVEIIGDQNDPRQESEVELKEGQTAVGGINASGSMPIVETDEEHAGGVNVKTNRIDEEKGEHVLNKRNSDHANDVTN